MLLSQSLTDSLQSEFERTDLTSLGIHLALVLVLSHVLGWHYARFAHVLSDRHKLGRTLVFVATTTLLVISVVKTSLALSLGLVGALSIIRFRTPIKEPEELAYLFLAVALGVGLGAQRPLETVLIFTAVLVAMAFRARSAKGQGRLRTILQVQAPRSADGPTLDQLMPAVTPHCARIDLRRVDYSDAGFHASLLVEIAAADRLHGLLASVRNAVPGAAVSAVERDSLD